MKAMKAAKAMNARKSVKLWGRTARAMCKKKKVSADGELFARCCRNVTRLAANERVYNNWKTTNDAVRAECVLKKKAIEDELRDVKTSILAELESHQSDPIRLWQSCELRKRLGELEVGLLRCDLRITSLECEDNEVERRLGPIKIDKAHWARRQNEFQQKRLGGEGGLTRRITAAAQSTINEVDSTGRHSHVQALEALSELPEKRQKLETVDDALPLETTAPASTPSTSADSRQNMRQSATRQSDGEPPCNAAVAPPSSAATSSTGDRQGSEAAPAGIARTGLAGDILEPHGNLCGFCGDTGYLQVVGTFPNDLFAGPFPGHQLPDQTKFGIMVSGKKPRCFVGLVTAASPCSCSEVTPRTDNTTERHSQTTHRLLRNCANLGGQFIRRSRGN